jgi:hypothetical protein
MKTTVTKHYKIISACLAVLSFLATVQVVIAEDGNGGYSGGYGGSSANYGQSSSVYGRNAYADTSQTYYDGYAQSWRYLGWYVDCNGGSNRYYQRSGGGGGSGSGSNDQSSKVGNNYCQRYLMWAAVSFILNVCVCACVRVFVLQKSSGCTVLYMYLTQITTRSINLHNHCYYISYHTKQTVRR